jgi:hypothetical protein
MTNPVLQLDAEWRQQLPEFRSRFCDWRRRSATLRRFASVDELHVFLRRGDEVAELDAVLRALLELAATEALAARLVLEALMPGMKLRAQRLLASERVEHDECWELLLAHAWRLIRECELRPGCRNVAVSLLFDIVDLTLADLEVRELNLDEVGHGVRPERAARILGHDRSPDGYLIDDPDPQDEADLRLERRSDWEPLLASAVTHGTLSDEEAFLIEATRIDGVSLTAMSIHLGVPREAVKKRRQRAERRVRLLREMQGDVPAEARNAVCIDAGAERNGAQIHHLELARPLPDQAA